MPEALPATFERWILSTRDENAVEEMDKPGCDPAKLARTYAQFPLINRVVSRWHSVYKHQIKPLLSPTQETTLLDIGCGGGDIAADLARWAARDGLRLAITAIDPDSRAIDFARTATTSTPQPGVTFRCAHSASLVAEGAMFDVVISNHMLHHLTPGEFQGLLHDSALLARRAVIHSDIVRSPLAYALFSVGTLPFFPGSFIRTDGLTSIRRSYTAPELRAVLPPGWRVESALPYRNLVLLSPSKPHV
ncbi:class I SAM-dependent methyltransferase [Arthrobacter sp. TWP1-1]|uniref:class I SAM-dependent methyltransferase n=1 Tax=Arthrobacter sp. TWP1-1 TaxID=2804568 RepID=UPI003CEB0ABC